MLEITREYEVCSYRALPLHDHRLMHFVLYGPVIEADYVL